MPTKYFAGNSLAAFFRNSNSIVETTTAGRFDSAYVSSAITIPNSGDVIQTSPFSASGTIWIRWDFNIDTNNNSSNTWFLLSNAGVNVFRIVAGQASYWSGGAWVTTGSAVSAPASGNNTWALKIVLNSGFELYKGGTLVANGSGWSGGQTAATLAQFGKWFANNTCHFSQVMIADYDIRDSHFLAAALNGNSASNTGAATGGYSDINETVLDDSTSLTITAAGNKAGQVFADITLPPGYIIGGMVINGRGRVNGTITDGKLGVRGSSGTNSSGSGLGYNGGYEPRCRIVTADPDTGTNFTQSGFNASEIYEEAV